MISCYLWMLFMLLIVSIILRSTTALVTSPKQLLRVQQQPRSSTIRKLTRISNSFHHPSFFISQGITTTGAISMAASSSSSTSTAATTTTATTLTFIGEQRDDFVSTKYNTTVLIGKKDVLQSLIDQDASLSTVLRGPTNREGDDAATEITTKIIASMMESAKPKSATTSFLPTGQKLALGLLPSKVSRNNHPMSVHVITDLVASTCSNNNKNGITRLVLTGCNTQEASPPILASAIAKAFPLYSRKTNGQDDDDDDAENTTDTNSSEKHVHISFLDETGKIMTDKTLLNAARIVAANVRLAACLVDMTPAELTTTVYADKVKAIAAGLPNVVWKEMVGDELRDAGYGGLYGVGKAAECPPRLLLLEYTPASASASAESSSTTTIETVALVGKGIVYDTGGLSLKPKTGMAGMKGDMGGSAGLLGAFVSAVQLQLPKKITLLLCLAENAIGATAFRNDDILTLYSGKTVEVNNCDAEGRLVLGDGVAHSTKHIEGLNLLIDMATLTGAQAVATGKKHASILANTAELEQRAVNAGLRSGDLCYPILYAPELLMAEFDSKVADMKNSVKDRNNAQPSCAGHFIEQHLHKDYKGGWLHVDMAAPSCKAERGTGYGVGLILSLLEAPGF